MTEIDTAELTAALQRADKLIRWMSSYIGKMAPGDYADCYRDLNTHAMFMDRFYPPADERTTQYQAGRQRGATVLRQMPEGFDLMGWMRDPKNAPEPRDHDDFMAGYWSVTVSPSSVGR